MRATRRQGRRRIRVTTVLAVTLLGIGGALLVGVLFAPQAVERAYGEAKTTVAGAVDSIREQTLDEIPNVSLGATGGMTELDRCDGTFTEMSSYEHGDVPPVWAAHNNCAGDVLLPWEAGQRIQLDDDQVYEIVDIRYTPKTWATVDDIVGLDGELALQTCFYGEDRMKFIGLEPVEGDAS